MLAPVATQQNNGHVSAQCIQCMFIYIMCKEKQEVKSSLLTRQANGMKQKICKKIKKKQSGGKHEVSQTNSIIPSLSL